MSLLIDFFCVGPKAKEGQRNEDRVVGPTSGTERRNMTVVASIRRPIHKPIY